MAAGVLMRGPSPIQKRLVLIGGGHAHVTVLKSIGMRPEPGLDVTLVAKELDAPYSGMLPGFVAGHYTLDDCQIDLVRLAGFAGVRLIHGIATGIDRARRHVRIEGRPPIAYDLLSLDTGITPLIDDIAGAREHAIAVKPVSTFAPRWQALEARALLKEGPRRIAVIGTGAAGFELILAMRHRLRALAPRYGIAPDAFTFTLIGGGLLLANHNSRARRFARNALGAAGVVLIEGDAAVGVAGDQVRLASGRVVAADATLVTTKAEAPAWFAASGLPVDDKGFLAVRPSLQARDDDDVFAVGDCASVIGYPREKAGVFAVRQGPPLTENIRLRSQGLPARLFRPQSRFLTLLALGDRRAIASRGAFAAHGGWAWQWKDHIDREFMDRFNHLPAMSPDTARDNPRDMRCGGCAAKLGPVTLRSALDRLGPLPGNATVRDLHPGEDAAILDLGGNELRLETVDFFQAFWADPYVLGEVAAMHAISDILAKGGRPDHATAIAVIPVMAPHLVAEDLFQLMSGARAAFDREGIALVGGHSSEGAELGVGFFVSGTVARDKLLLKRGLKPGDRLILTKPLGTGILFAAAMRRRARASDIAAALAGMRRSNADAARILVEHGATAATDVTGFGLAGHLIEMLGASGVSARMEVGQLRLYPGVGLLARAGIVSSLLEENLALRAHLSGTGAGDAATLALLLDPQTSGGLLAGLPEARATACLAALRAAGHDAAIVATATARRAGDPVMISLDTPFGSPVTLSEPHTATGDPT